MHNINLYSCFAGDSFTIFHYCADFDENRTRTKWKKRNKKSEKNTNDIEKPNKIHADCDKFYKCSCCSCYCCFFYVAESWKQLQQQQQQKCNLCVFDHFCHFRLSALPLFYIPAEHNYKISPLPVPLSLSPPLHPPLPIYICNLFCIIL